MPGLKLPADWMPSEWTRYADGAFSGAAKVETIRSTFDGTGLSTNMFQGRLINATKSQSGMCVRALLHTLPPLLRPARL